MLSMASVCVCSTLLFYISVDAAAAAADLKYDAKF